MSDPSHERDTETRSYWKTAGTATEVLCPVCRQRIALTPRRQHLKKHYDENGKLCAASGQRPTSNLVKVNARRSLIRRIGKWVYALIFTVLAGLLGILGYFGIAPEGTDPKGSPSRPAEVVPTDPYLYVAFGSQHIARTQDCEGLLGLCLGQPVSLAIQAFGTREASGFPQSGGGPSEYGRATTCHRWELARIDSMTICDDNGAIVSVRLDSFSSTELNLAAPQNLKIQFPFSVASNAANITNALRGRPFESQYLQGEGESVFTFQWFFPAVTEGSPDTKIRIIGRIGTFPSKQPTACSEEPVRHKYNDVLVLSKDAQITSVEVALTAPNDFKEPQYC
jgi:hypothetical protein